MSEARPQSEHPAPARRPAAFGLASRVLLLTIAFVMLAEIAVYVPSIANYRDNWLRDRLSAAYTAALVLEAAPDAAVPDSLRNELLASVGAQAIAIKRGDARRLLAMSDMPPMAEERYDLRSASAWQSIAAAWATLTADHDRVITVVGDAPMGAQFVEIALQEAPLRDAMFRYSRNILLISLAISAMVAGLAMGAIHLMVLRPVRRLTSNLTAFGANPEDVSRRITPSGSRDEIGYAEEALAEMQKSLAEELAKNRHLAALGLAVAKINHDLRNMLSSAQLISDRLATGADPLTRRLAPKLVATLDRAIAFCQSTLTYGRAAERAPQPERLRLHALANEAADIVSPPGAGRAIPIVNFVPKDISIRADNEQLLRVLVNLFRNAVEALESAGAQSGQTPQVRIDATRGADMVTIEISDNGPGVPPAARARLFEAFQASNRAGGSGLGLAIAAELVRAHGGDIALVEGVASLSDGQTGCGATFRIYLPDRRAVAVA